MLYSHSSVALVLPTFRSQNPVQEWKVPGGDSRVLTTQVSFNRKNEYLLASAKINQVYIWDSRKVGLGVSVFLLSVCNCCVGAISFAQGLVWVLTHVHHSTPVFLHCAYIDT